MDEVTKLFFGEGEDVDVFGHELHRLAPPKTINVSSTQQSGVNDTGATHCIVPLSGVQRPIPAARLDAVTTTDMETICHRLVITVAYQLSNRKTLRPNLFWVWELFSPSLHRKVVYTLREKVFC